VGWEGFEVLVGEGVVLGEYDGDLAEGAGLEGADSSAGTFADLMDGESLDFAEADDEETLGLEAVGGVEKDVLAERGFEFSGGEDLGGGVRDGV
jgi:hypothetical protein